MKIMAMLLFLLLTFPFPPFNSAADGLSFNLAGTRMSDRRLFNYSGDVIIDGGGLHLTPNGRNQVGRVTYFEPLRLWDKISTNLTDFTSNFTFVINSNGRAPFADGLAFFLAPLDSTIRNWSIGGSSLGLGNATSFRSSFPSPTSFVAVEFDTFPNPFDPKYSPHVGIDIDNVTSVIATPWSNDVTLGLENTARVRYSAATMLLTVDFTGKNRTATQFGALSYEVDLREWLPENVAVGFSAATGGSVDEKHIIKSWSFSSTLPTPTPTPTTPTPTGPSNNGRPAPNRGPGYKGLKRSNTILATFVGLLGLALISVGVLYGIHTMKMKRKEDEEGSEEEEELLEIDGGPRQYRYRQVVSATNSFAEENKLGSGGFGPVYSGVLNHESVAVKRLASDSDQGETEFRAEIGIISLVRHKNLVRLIGWAYKKKELLLVYNLIPNGSLDKLLYSDPPRLDWPKRFHIAKGLASAIAYLHEEMEPHVLHRDLKPSNIMLDAGFNPVIGDFGLARLVENGEECKTTKAAGSYGYVDPEYFLRGARAQKWHDIYSLGMIMLELAAGRRYLEHNYPEEEKILLYHARALLDLNDDHIMRAADTKLRRSETEEPYVRQLLLLGLTCCEDDTNLRPTAKEISEQLDQILF